MLVPLLIAWQSLYFPYCDIRLDANERKDQMNVMISFLNIAYSTNTLGGSPLSGGHELDALH